MSAQAIVIALMLGVDDAPTPTRFGESLRFRTSIILLIWQPGGVPTRVAHKTSCGYTGDSGDNFRSAQIGAMASTPAGLLSACRSDAIDWGSVKRKRRRSPCQGKAEARGAACGSCANTDGTFVTGAARCIWQPLALCRTGPHTRGPFGAAPPTLCTGPLAIFSGGCALID